MKKIIVIFLVSFSSFAVHAQLKNTKWKGIIHSDDDFSVVFEFGSDTLEVTNMADSSSLETLIYTAKDSILTLRKTYGQSGCDVTGTGEYKFYIKSDALYMTLQSDACEDRSSALNNSKWDRLK